PITGVAFFPGSRMVASTGVDSTVRLWNSDGGEIGAPLVHDPFAHYYRVAVSPPIGRERRRILAAGSVSGAGGVALWNVTHPSKPRYISTISPTNHQRNAINDVAFYPERPHLLAVAGPTNRISLWKVDRDQAHAFGRDVR